MITEGLLGNNSIIWVVGGLFLLAAFLRFKSQVFAFLYRLTRIEIPGLKKSPIKNKLIRQADASPWTWHRLWMNILLHPNSETSTKLLSEGKFSFLRTCVWLVSMSIIFQIFYSLVFYPRPSFPIGFIDILKFLSDGLLTGLALPAIFVFLTGLIHMIAKLFGGRQAFQGFFIVYVAFTFPVMILVLAFLPISQWFTGKIPSYIGTAFSLYAYIVVPAKAVKAYYHFSGFKSFLITFFVQAVFVFLMLFLIAYSNIIKS